MSRNPLDTGVVLLTVLSFLVVATSAQDSPSGSVRAVSLRVLQKQCEDSRGEPLADQILNLGGLARVDGFIIDRTGKDIVLVGVAGTEAGSSLLTEDLAVALRNAWRDRLEAPDVPGLGFLGCSIDHDAGTYQVLMQAASRIGMHTPVPGDVDRWNRLCERPMTVSISEIPPTSHFARVIFDADLSLKRLVLGLDSPDPSFRSLLDFIKEQAELVEKTGGRVMMLPILNVWLVSGANVYAESGNTTWLDACPVVMSTDECLVMEGTLACSGRTHPSVRKLPTVSRSWSL